MYRDYRAKRKYIDKLKVAAMQLRQRRVWRQSEVEVLLTKAIEYLRTKEL